MNGVNRNQSLVGHVPTIVNTLYLGRAEHLYFRYGPKPLSYRFVLRLFPFFEGLIFSLDDPLEIINFLVEVQPDVILTLDPVMIIFSIKLLLA